MIPNDPVILLSYVNLKLRDYYEDLDDLCQDLNVSRQDLETKLGVIDYHYSDETNQFV